MVSMVLGAVFPLLVMTGTHYAIVPVGINNRMTMGYDSLVYPNNLASNIAQGAATLAVAFKSKVEETRQLAYSAGITAVCGITEPALFVSMFLNVLLCIRLWQEVQQEDCLWA